MSLLRVADEPGVPAACGVCLQVLELQSGIHGFEPVERRNTPLVLPIRMGGVKRAAGTPGGNRLYRLLCEEWGETAVEAALLAGMIAMGSLLGFLCLMPLALFIAASLV